MNKLEKTLCAVADELMRQYDPCKIQNGRCRRGDLPCCHATYFYPKGCPYLKKKCTKPNIKCKVGFCRRATRKMSEECFRSFEHVESIARINKIRIRPPRLNDLRP